MKQENNLLFDFIFIFAGSFLFFSGFSQAAQSIAVQGRLLNSDGSAVTATSVQFTIKVKSPGTEDCVLYQETQTLNLSQSEGAFALTLGSGTRAAVSVDGGNPLNTVFSNSLPISLTAAPTACSNAATSYSPTVSDTRNLEITFDDGSGVDSIPSIPLVWTPQSIYSQDSGKLAGVNATQYLKIANGTTPSTLSASDYSNLITLINGSSTQYLSSSASSGVLLPNLASAPTSLSAGQIWFDSVSNTMKYYNGTATQTIGTSSGLSSIGFSMPGIFSVSGSPLTSNGTITTTLANQSANTIFAGPVSGGPATPTFRAIAATDLPISASGGIIKDGGNSLGSAMTLGTNDSNNLGFKTNNSTRLTINSSGDVGIGTSSPTGTIHVVGGTAAASTNGTNITLQAQNAGSGNQNGGNIVLTPGNYSGTGYPGGVGINSTPNGNYIFQVYTNGGPTGAQRYVGYEYNNSSIADMGFNITKSKTGGVTSSDALGNISFIGRDSTGSGVTGAQIRSWIDGTPSTGQSPANLVFSTMKDGTSTLSERMRITNSGNVGIGTSAPLATLDLVGTSQLGNIGPSSATTLSIAVVPSDTVLNVVSTTGHPNSGILYITDNATFEEAVTYTGKTATTFTGLTRGLYGTTAKSWAIGTSVDLVIQVISGSSNTVAPRVFYTQTKGMGYGRVPAAWTGPGSQYSGTLMTGTGMQISNANTGISWGTSSTNIFGSGTSSSSDFVRFVTNFNEKMRIDGSGKVGINSFAPRGPLEVNEIPNTRLSTSINSAVTTMTVSSNSFPSTGTLIIDSEQMSYSGGGTTTFTVTRAANATIAAAHNSGSPISFYGSSSFIVASNGNVGIGTTVPNYKLDVAGDINTSSCFRIGATTVSGVCTSDERIKENVQDYLGGLSDIINIKLHTYTFNGLGEMPKTGEVAIGVIAQEVERTNPELVKTRLVKMRPEDKETTEIKVVDYSKFSYMLINAVKELYHKWLEDHSDLQTLKAENQVLKEQVRKLATENEKTQSDSLLLKTYLCQKEPKAPICH